jgi:hypothetical protein
MNTDIPMPNIKHLVMDSDEEDLNISRNILDDEELKFYRLMICGRNADLCAIEAQMDTLW